MVEHIDTHSRSSPIRPPLTRDGSIAALVVGAAALAGGVPWALLLIAWFVVAVGLTAVGRERKRALSDSVIEGEVGRNARQVVANGGVFALAVVAARLTGEPSWQFAALGALAAAAADTWATEIGLLVGGAPIDLRTGDRAEPGTSGAVTIAGTFASAAGALAVAAGGIAVLSAVRGVTANAPQVLVAIGGAGMLGALFDSILGATLQARRRCERCQVWTERAVHFCGHVTVHARGVRFLDNDGVNFLTTIAGATVAVLLWHLI